jgi:hypothetical protein
VSRGTFPPWVGVTVGLWDPADQTGIPKSFRLYCVEELALRRPGAENVTGGPPSIEYVAVVSWWENSVGVVPYQETNTFRTVG